MKKRKNMGLTAVALSLAAIMVFTVPALAYDWSSDSADHTAGTEIELDIAEHYEVTIPAKIRFESPDTLTYTDELIAEKVTLESGKSLVVSVSADNDYSLNLEADGILSEVPYTVTASDGTVLSGTNEVMSIPAGTPDGSEEFTFEVTQESIDGATIVGKHTDLLTFVSEVV